MSYGGVDVAKIKRQCNGNANKPIGWTIEFSANAHENTDGRQEEMRLLQANEQGKAPFPTWRAAIDAVAKFFGKKAQIPDKPIVVAHTQDSVTISIRQKRYKYTCSPFILGKFFGIYQRSAFKALNFIKKHGKLD